MIAKIQTKETHKASCECPACQGLVCLERPRYFAGQLLTEQELNSSQAYALAKNRLHNRYLHGYGVVCGLQVSCHDCEGHVTVHPGYALDQCGNDILVCEPHDFDLIAAIRACKERERKERDCDPWREPFRKGCEGVEEKWCITIRYKEKEAQPRAALVSTSASSCGCGGAKNGGSSNCGCQSAPSNGGARPRTANSCEPTRVIESYELGVFRADDLGGSKEDEDSFFENLLEALEELGLHVPYQELICCMEPLLGFFKQGAEIAELMEDSVFSNRQAIYARLCNLRKDLRRLLLDRPLLACELMERLALVVIPPPPDSDDDIEAWGMLAQQALNEMGAILFNWLVDCICYSILPTCPDDPCEDRLILACVTVRDDDIVRICHTEGRRYTLTPRNAISAIMTLFMDELCCDEIELPAGVMRGEALGNMSRSVSGIAFKSPRFVRLANLGFFSSAFGAVEEEENKVAAVEFIGQPAEEMEEKLKAEGTEVNVVEVSWTPAKTIMSSLERPFVARGEALNLYKDKKTGEVIGVAPQTGRVQLKRNLQDAHARIDSLEKQVEALLKELGK